MKYFYFHVVINTSVLVSVFVCMLPVLLVILASEELQVCPAGKLAKQVTSERKKEKKGPKRIRKKTDAAQKRHNITMHVYV